MRQHNVAHSRAPRLVCLKAVVCLVAFDERGTEDSKYGTRHLHESTWNSYDQLETIIFLIRPRPSVSVIRRTDIGAPS
jgi:hypothetical protein